MYHAVYLKTLPNRSYYLKLVFKSIDEAVKTAGELSESARKQGFEKAETIVETFEDQYSIPETMKKIRFGKPLLN